MKIKDINEKCHCIGILLKYDPKGNILGKLIDTNKLDFSVKSLKLVDNYLDKVRKRRKKLNETEIKTVILRCGTYLGEVIKKVKLKRVIWIDYNTACGLIKTVEQLGHDITTGMILYDIEQQRVWFPLSKVYKFLEYGRGDNLWSFATVMLKYKE